MVFPGARPTQRPATQPSQPGGTDHGRSRIGVVLTGGTIASQRGADDVFRVAYGPEGGLSPPDFDTHVPVCQPLHILSEDMRPRDWVVIAQAVRGLVADESVGGVVVLHGTDTMAYTTAALSFLLADLPIPVVLTGSNVASSEDNSDAATNIRDAFSAASMMPPGVFLCFAGIPGAPSLIHLGTRVRKLRAAGHAFASIGGGPLGEVTDQKVHLKTAVPDRSAVTGAQLAIDERVLAVTLYPGCPLAAFSRLVHEEGIRGVVVEMYASATGPAGGDKGSLTSFTRSCIEQDVVVIGSVNQGLPPSTGRYESTVAFEHSGGVLLPDLLPETATVKLMWALGQGHDRLWVERVMATSVAGELGGGTPTT